MSATIGQQLRHAREAKGLSITDAANETHIHAPILHGLEDDDYSSFASITYAKNFLKLYSRYLDVDASEALAMFQSNSSANIHGADVFTDIRETISPMGGYAEKRSSRPSSRSRAAKPGVPIFFGLIVFVLVVSIPAFYYLGWKAENPDEIVPEITKNAQKTVNDLLDQDDETEQEALPKKMRTPLEIAEQNLESPDPDDAPTVAKPPPAEVMRAVPITENDKPEPPASAKPVEPENAPIRAVPIRP